jgi:hypothetical protein
MVVYNAIVSAEQGGILGRPDTKISKIENLYIIGDWIGPEGLLGDASFASACDPVYFQLGGSPTT